MVHFSSLDYVPNQQGKIFKPPGHHVYSMPVPCPESMLYVCVSQHTWGAHREFISHLFILLCVAWEKVCLEWSNFEILWHCFCLETVVWKNKRCFLIPCTVCIWLTHRTTLTFCGLLLIAFSRACRCLPTNIWLWGNYQQVWQQFLNTSPGPSG